MPQFTKYFPLVKVDEKSHTISGIATAEEPDKDGEIADYEWCKTQAYPTWSEEASESTKAAGQEISYGNIRVQHTLEIGGKVKAPVVYDDESKSVHIDTEPENESIWTKAKKGFIRGFSHSGDYAWRKCNVCRTDMAKGNTCPKCKRTVLVRYGPVIAEVSYVDNPALKVATFSLVKADGTTELRKFAEGNSQMEPTTEETAVDVPALAEQVTTSVLEKLGKAVKYLAHDAKGKGHLPYTKADGKPDHRLMGAAWAALHAGYRGNKYSGPEKAKALERLKEIYSKEGLATPSEKSAKAAKAVETLVEKASATGGLHKGMYQVSRFAELLASLASLQVSALYERDSEEDDSALPDELLEDLEALVETFLAMAEEEAHELTAPGGERGMYMAQEATDLVKAARKTLASHFKKAAAHHEKMAAHHKDMHEAHSDRLEATKEDKSAHAFHKAMCGSHEKCMKAHTAQAENCSQMAESHAEEAQKTTSPEGLVKTEQKTEPAAASTAAAAAGTAEPGTDPSVQSAMQKMMGAAFIEMFKGTLGEMQNSPEVKKMIADSVVSQMAETLGKQMVPDGVKLAGSQLVARPGESLLSKAATDDGYDTGL